MLKELLVDNSNTSLIIVIILSYIVVMT